MKSPRILISNDDGIQATGLLVLAAAMREVGDVWVVAPDRERSATSHSISLHQPLRIRQEAEREYSVDGTPSDCVYVALHHLLPEPPDVVVSGINHGQNLGNDVLYSGTVSAAMEGALFGLRAIAMSMCLPERRLQHETTADHFAQAARFAVGLVQSVLEKPMPPGVLLNANVPSGAVKGMKLCRLGYTDWVDHVTERQDPRGRPYYWIGGARQGHDDIIDSDHNAIADGYVAVTPIHYDITDYRSFSYTRGLSVAGFERVNDTLGDVPLPHPVRRKR